MSESEPQPGVESEPRPGVESEPRPGVESEPRAEVESDPRPGVESGPPPDVEAELLAREPIFHKPELGTTREAYAAQTAGDFWEVGASGRVYDREHVIDALVGRGKVSGDERWVISDSRCRPLGADTYALTYQLDQSGRLTRRLTLWRRESDGWKVLYHQGTLIQDA